MLTRARFGSSIVPLSVGLCVAFVSVGVPAPVPKGKEPTTPFVKWAAKDEFASNDPHDPLVVGDKVVVGTDKEGLGAYGCVDGKLAWSHEHGHRVFHRPSSDGQRVYFSSEKGLFAVSAKDGKRAWALDRAGIDGPTLALPKLGLVCVGGQDGILYAVDAKAGKQRWTADFLADAPADRPGFPGEQARLAGTRARPSALATDGEAVYLSVFDQSRLVAVRAKTGKRLWAFQADGWAYGPAVATAKHVFIGSQDKNFYCLDKKTGKQVWKYETFGRIESGGAVDDANVYFGSCDGSLYCLKQSDGKKRWHFAAEPRPGGRKGPIYSVPLLRGSTVCFAAGEGQVYGVDRGTGKLKWKIRPAKRSELFCSPAADRSLTFVVTREADKGVGEASLVAIGLK